MAIHAGRHHLGTEQGRLVLTTLRDGLAAQAGHDLTLAAGRWSGELVVGDDLAPTSLDVRVDLGSLVVAAAAGGLKPLTDSDRREIAATARKVLQADRHPEASFSATAFQPGANGGGAITGTLTLAGRSRPLRLDVTRTDPGRYRASATVRQTDFGVKPYSAFFGSLKVRDAVGVQVELALPDTSPDGTTSETGPASETGTPGTRS